MWPTTENRSTGRFRANAAIFQNDAEMIIGEYRQKSADSYDPRLEIAPWLREMIDASRVARGLRVAQYGRLAGASGPEGNQQ